MAKKKNHPDQNRYAYVKTGERLAIDDWIDFCVKNAHPKRGISARKRRWMKLIEAGKLTCVASGVEVDHISLDHFYLRKGGYTEHWNFYGRHGQMFTIDHTEAIFNGGDEMDVDNLEPMVAEHNWLKGASEFEGVYQLDTRPFTGENLKIIGEQLPTNSIIKYISENISNDVLTLDDDKVGKIHHFLETCCNTSGSTFKLEIY